MLPDGVAPFSRVLTVAQAGSTNSDLAAARAANPAQWPHLSALRAVHQDAGRGRLDRQWVTPPGRALTFSTVLLPSRPREEWASLTTLGGLAVVRAVRALGADAALKWPNDVVVRGAGEEILGWGTSRKLAGVLAEVARDVEGADAVILGIGVNVGQQELPVPWATSLALVGLDIAPEALLTAIGQELGTLWETWEAGGAAALQAEVVAASDTLGRAVSVERLGAQTLHGKAEALDGEGRLLLRLTDGSLAVIAFGDVHHLRLG